MLIEETRQKNIVCLWRQRAILQKDFAKLVVVSANQMNQYFTGFRNMGPRTARKVETKLKLPRGWIDEPHPEEWELSNSAYDGRVRSRALSRIGATLAARIESLTDDRAVEKITELIELLEERQERGSPTPAHSHKPKPD